MGSFNRIYSVDSKGELLSHSDFNELLRVLEHISEKYGIKLKSIGNQRVKVSGTPEQLALAEKLINDLTQDTNLEYKEDLIAGSLDEFLNLSERDVAIESLQNQKDGGEKNGIPELVHKDGAAENGVFVSKTAQSSNAEKNQAHNHSQNQQQSQIAKSALNGEQAEVVLDDMVRFEKPTLHDEAFHSDDGDSIAPLGMLSDVPVETSSAGDMSEHVNEPVVIVTQEAEPEPEAPPPNANPVAGDDAIAVNQDTTTDIYATVLANDTDLQVLSVSAIDVTGTTGVATLNVGAGTLTYATGNSFDYLAVGETTTDTFDYTVDDGLGGTDTATVTVTITGVNDTPVGVADSASVNENATTANLHATLLANDTDADTSDTLDILSIDTTGTNGTVTFDGVANSLTYEATGHEYLSVGVTTTDSFVYTVSDGNGGTSDVTVTMTVTGVNDAPVAQNDAISTDEDTPIAGSVFVDNGSGADNDVDATDTFSVSAVAGGVVGAPVAGSAGGLFTINADGTFSFDPNGEFEALGDAGNQVTTITYTIDDGNGGTDTATISVTVGGVNDAPTANDDGLYGELDEGGDTIVITKADLLANDTDPEGDGLDITAMVAGAGEGSLVDNLDGTWTYTSPADSLTFTGTATITCTVSDGALTTTSTVELRVFNVLAGDAGNNVLTYQNINTPHKIIGLDGNDTLTGGNARDILIGGDGNDILKGNDGDDDFVFEGALNGVDTVDGDAGTDRVIGGTGDDTFTVLTYTDIEEIDMGTGTDTLLGTAGNDSFYFGATTITDLDVIDGNGGTDTIVGTGGTETLDLSNVTTITGVDINLGAGNDTVRGSQGADSIIINTGSNNLYGQGGDDTFTIVALSGSNEIYGGAGYDQVIGTAGNDALILSGFTDIEYIDLGVGTNYIAPSYNIDLDFSSLTAGVDMLNVAYLTDGSGSGEVLTATQGDDEIRVKSDSHGDTFNGEAGDDTFVLSDGSTGGDRYNGGAGYDQIIGSAGDNAITLYSISGIEYIDLGTGTNYFAAAYNSDLDFSAYTSGTDLLNVTYFTDYTGSGDTLYTTQGDDEIRVTADAHADTYYGESGDDNFVLSAGSSGNERIYGGAGYDQILGSAGDNALGLYAISGIEYIDLGTGTNYIAAAYNSDLDFSSFTAGTDMLNVTYFTDYSGSGDVLTTTQGDDEIRITNDGHSDTYNGEAGDDIFTFSGSGFGNERIRGGAGYDQLIGSAGDDALVLHELSGIEFIDFGGGTNYMQSAYYAPGSTLDLSSYTSGVDILGLSYITDNTAGGTIYGTQGDDEIRMQSDGYADAFYGNDGDDTFIFSGDVNRGDRIIGGAGYDQIIGSAGDDGLSLHELSGIEFIDLGAGTNYIQSTYYAPGSTLDLSGWTQGVDLLGLSYITDNTAGGTIYGTNQDDEIRMQSDGYADAFYGNDGDDIFTLSGSVIRNDTINGGAGYDRIIGSAGTDVLQVNMSNIEYIDLGADWDGICATNSGAGTTLDLSGWTQGVDLIGVDFISDYDGYSNTIIGTSQNDWIQIQDDNSADSFSGGDGNDTFMVYGSLASNEIINGGAGTDCILAGWNATVDLSGYTVGVNLIGIEYIRDGSGSSDTIIGTNSADEIHVQDDAGADSFSGGGGNDVFMLDGGIATGADSFDGGTGTDQLIGSAGDDGLVLSSISSIETIDMGTGTDYIQAASGGNLDLSGYTQGVDLLGLEYITDNTGAETVVGTAQDDEIRIQGDANSDVFIGGNGADLFLLDSAKTAADVLSDFDITDNDVINISDVLSYNSGAGDLISDFIQLVDIGDGDPANGAGTVTMQIDVDGTANGVNFVDYFIFADQGMDVADLISGSNLIVE